MKALVLIVAAFLSAIAIHAQQPAMSIFDRLAALDLVNDPDMGRALDEEELGPFNVGILSAGANSGFGGIVRLKQPKAGAEGWTVGVAFVALQGDAVADQTVAVGLFMPRPFGDQSWLGLSLSFLHQALTNVPQDILAPVFSDSQSGIAAPDPYTNRDDYEADIAADIAINATYLMSCDLYNVTPGANLGVAIPLGFAKIRFQAGWNPQLRYISYDSSVSRPFELAIRGNADTWNVIDRVVLGAYVDGRDTFREPTQGFYLGQTVVLAGGFLLGARDFIQSDTRLEGFLPLVNVPLTTSASLKVVLAGYSGLSLLLPNFSVSHLAWETNVDSGEQFYIDGLGAARGISSLRRGNAMWNNKLELRIPVGPVWVVGFFDAAALWEQPFHPPLGDLFLYSFGTGLRLSSPTFPVRLYVARGFVVRSGQIVWAAANESLGGLRFSLIGSVGWDTF